MPAHPILEAALATITGLMFFAALIVPGFWLRFGCMPWEALQ
jgi:hypothetical protein